MKIYLPQLIYLIPCSRSRPESQTRPENRRPNLKRKYMI